MKRIKLTDDDVMSECRYQSSQASGSEFASDELTESRKNALRYYLGRSRGDEIEGRSDFISKDVADMIDAMLTQLMPMFGVDDLVQFEPLNEQDEDQARMESKFCNHVVMESNHGFILFETLLKDALLSKNAISKVRVDITEDVSKERYKGLSPQEMFVVLQPQLPKQEVKVTLFNEEEGKVNLKRITTKRKLCVEAVAPENFNITSEHKSQYLDDCTYCNERLYKTKSDLIEEGYDRKLIEPLPSATSDTKIDSVERNQINDEQNFFNREMSMQIVELEEHYIRIDQDGDGIAELHKVVTAENVLLSNEEVECVPYANGVAFLMGHRFYGQSVYDKIKDIQDSKTHFIRQWLDNALVHNHKKYLAVEDRVNMDDLLSGRPNGVVRVDSIDSVMELTTTDIAPSCVAGLDYMDKVRTERSGSSLDLQSNQMNMPSNVGNQGVNVLVANLEKVTTLVAKNFCETLIYSTYGLVHKFLRLYFPEEMTAKMSGTWATTNPQQWKERDTINIVVPATNSEKILQQLALEKAIMVAQQDMQAGKAGITTDESSIYQMKVDFMRLSGIDNPEKYLINPNSPQAQQVAQQQAQMQQQAQQAQAEKMENFQEEQMQLQIEMLKAQVMEIERNWENDKDQLEFDYTELERKLGMDKYTVDTKADMDEAKVVGEAATSFELEHIKSSNKGMKDNE